ncbi:MAG: hypothetical protein ABIT01_11315, partial [Thermoanaerobaculia bacterium]
MGCFKSQDEFKRVFDELFETLSNDPEVGPKLRATRSLQRYVFTDLGLTLNVRDADARRAAKGHALTWSWGEKCAWAPEVVLQMSSDVANRFFQGRENVPLAFARKIIVLKSGSMTQVLD